MLDKWTIGEYHNTTMKAIDGKKNKRLPQIRWGDDIRKIQAIHWKQKAQNRKKRKKLREAHVQNWMN